MFQQHELVQRVVPLHKENSTREGTAKVLVAIIRVSTHCTFATPLCVRYLQSKQKFYKFNKQVSITFFYLGRHAVLLGNKLLWYFGDGVDRKSESVVLLGVCVQTNLKAIVSAIFP